ARRISPMSINAIRYTFSAALFSVATIVTQAQSPSIDPTLAAQIAAIPAIDNHAHPLLSPPAYATDRNFDALPVDNMAPAPAPAARPIPFHNSDTTGSTATPARPQSFPPADQLPAQYLQQANLKSAPSTLDPYLTQLFTPLRAPQKSQGAVAEKFEVAYLRS